MAEFSTYLRKVIEKYTEDARVAQAGAPCVVCGGKPTVLHRFIPADPETFGGISGKVRISFMPLCDQCTEQAKADKNFLPEVVKMHLAENPQFDHRVGGRGITPEQLEDLIKERMKDDADDEDADQYIVPHYILN